MDKKHRMKESQKKNKKKRIGFLIKKFFREN